MLPTNRGKHILWPMPCPFRLTRAFVSGVFPSSPFQLRSWRTVSTKRKRAADGFTHRLPPRSGTAYGGWDPPGQSDAPAPSQYEPTQYSATPPPTASHMSLSSVTAESTMHTERTQSVARFTSPSEQAASRRRRLTSITISSGSPTSTTDSTSSSEAAATGNGE